MFGPLLVAFLFTHYGYTSVFIDIATCWLLVALTIGSFRPNDEREDASLAAVGDTETRDKSYASASTLTDLPLYPT